MTTQEILGEFAKTLRVAIVGGGPGGLAAGIALSALSNVEVTIFEKATELREIGAGVSIGLNCWHVLGLLGAAPDVKGHRRLAVEHRNGMTGDLAVATATSLPPQFHPRRVRRTRLQSALLARVPRGIIQLNKCLVSLQDIEEGGVRLIFRDGTEATADLVVGADGIRSAVRENIFPDHMTKFTGTTIWRTLIPSSAVSHLPQLNTVTTWFHSPRGFVMTTPVDDPEEIPRLEDRLFEISIRQWVDPETVVEEKFRWGIDATNEKVLSHFKEYTPVVQEVLSLVPEGGWREYSAFAGPRLHTLTGWGKVVLLGDASHPLSGAFGSGAAFAMEDGWLLSCILKYTCSKVKSKASAIEEAIKVFDEIRTPYYLKMYDYIGAQDRRIEGAKRNASAAGISEWEAQLRNTIMTFVGDGLSWIYLNNIEDVWAKYVEDQERLNIAHL